MRELNTAAPEKVTDPAKVPKALDRAIKEVKGGRTAVLHVTVTQL